jgi:thiamine-phosphate pyrophosphorylase
MRAEYEKNFLSTPTPSLELLKGKARKVTNLKKIGRFHVLTDTFLQNRLSHLELAELAIAGGADTIQYRQKSGTTKEMILITGQMQAVCQRTGVTLIVNDRLDLALASKTDGIHLGQDDFPIPLARKILGQKAVIGGSAGTLEEARKCLLEGADYIGFGPVFPTTSKEDAAPAGGLDLLEHVVKEIALPIIAIGGINQENTPQVMKTGAYGIAVISAVCCQEDPKEATRVLRKLMESNRHD